MSFLTDSKTMFIRKIIIIIIFAFLFITPLKTRAAVPVVVFGDYLNEIRNIKSNTDFETSLEKFMFNLFTALSQKEEDFITSFELAKTEQARADVAKLIRDTLNELKGEGNVIPLYNEDIKTIAAYLKDKGIKINLTDQNKDENCVTGIRLDNGDCVIIKKESRIIRNVDDFLNEEPIQKARHYVNCALGRWKDFPFAAADEESGRIRDEMRKEFLLKLGRKSKFATMVVVGGKEYPFYELNPPTDWYTQDRCEVIMSTIGCRIDSEDEARSETGESQEDNQGGSKGASCKYNFLLSEPTLEKPLAYYDVLSWDLINKADDPKNSYNDTYYEIDTTIDKIIADYHEQRLAEYTAGQGIRSEKYLLGFSGFVEGGEFGGRQATENEYFFFDTDYVISPAVILVQKMAAATQAEFDLARQGFKVEPSRSGEGSSTMSAASTERTTTLEPFTVLQSLNSHDSHDSSGTTNNLPSSDGSFPNDWPRYLSIDDWSFESRPAEPDQPTSSILDRAVRLGILTDSERNTTYGQLRTGGVSLPSDLFEDSITNNTLTLNNAVSLIKTAASNQFSIPTTITDVLTRGIRTGALSQNNAINIISGSINNRFPLSSSVGSLLLNGIGSGRVRVSDAVNIISGSVNNFVPIPNSIGNLLTNSVYGGVPYSSATSVLLNSVTRNLPLSSSMGSLLNNTVAAGGTNYYGAVGFLDNSLSNNVPIPTDLGGLMSTSIAEGTLSSGNALGLLNSAVSRGSFSSLLSSFGGGSSGTTITNGAGTTIGTIPSWSKPGVNELPAPWEDTSDYVKVSGTLPLKDWYENVMKMHTKTFPQILEEWFFTEESVLSEKTAAQTQTQR